MRFLNVLNSPRTPKVVGWICATVVWVTCLAFIAAGQVKGTERERFDASAWLPTADARPVGDYFLSYDGRTRSARYVVEVLTPASLAKRVSRATGFRVDAAAIAEARATPADYAGSGFDQGHLAPAADHLRDSEAQLATFVLSNVAPQTPESNRGTWKQLEEHVRNLASECERAIVVTAPAYYSRDRPQLTVELIGRNRVWVPTHFAKAVCLQRAGSVELRAWLVPNDLCDVSYDACEISVDEFESVVGVDVFAPLDDRTEAQLERVRPQLLPVPE